MKYTTNDLIIFALFGALLFVFGITVCPALNVILGLAGTCGIIGLINEPFGATLVAWLTKKPYAFAIVLLIKTFLAVPASSIPLLMVIVLPFAGLLVEPLIRRYTKKSSAVAGGIYLLLSAFLILGFASWLGLPIAGAWNKVAASGPLIVAGGIIAILITGAAGSFFAVMLYERIKHYRIVKYIQRG